MRHAPLPKNAEWDSDPAAYDRLRQQAGWITQRRRQYLHDWLQGLPHAKQILEIGSGTGRLLLELADALPGRRWTGLEPLPAYIAYAQKLRQTQSHMSNVAFRMGSAEQADAALKPDTGYAAILSNDVLHHLDNYDAALGAIARLAPKDAEWCAIEPNVLNPYAAFNQWRRKHEKNFWPQPFLRAAERAGWRLKRKEYLFLIPPAIPNPPNWLKLAERRLEKTPLLAGGVALVLQRR
jgi:SAM-dependent methyltransferase